MLSFFGEDYEKSRNNFNYILYYEEDLEHNQYIIYDKEDNIVSIVYNKDDLDFYKSNPDYRPSVGKFFSEEEVVLEEQIDE